ncbi:hypothetical protein [Amycolatopsis sp. CA-126428]|uniref:hypothetical protein n=1 Tax=Amycolatopsis sp. CA-126428 TaxID=2073158 RepID=UPI000CD2A6FC|nr:hypothetical protein [Amycolatopsis sp. CA-126428]
MTRWDDSLRQVIELNRTVKPTQAEALMTEVLQGCTLEELGTLEAEIALAISSFLRKRQKSLTQLLEKVSRDGASPAATQIADTSTPVVDENFVAYSRDRLHRDLGELADHHIFQWATFYRDVLNAYFDEFLHQLTLGGPQGTWLIVMKKAMREHASDIFQRGYRHQLVLNPGNSHYALAKSLAGLQRFLDLPLEFYSTRRIDAHHDNNAAALRRLCSAMVSGILLGYSTAVFNRRGGWVLPGAAGAWGHALPFLAADDLREVLASLEPGELTDSVHDSVLPLARAVDTLLQRDPDGAPLPALSQYVGGRRLEVFLELPQKDVGSRRIEVHCYLSAASVERFEIEEAATRAVSAVVAPMRADLRSEMMRPHHLADMLVATETIDGHEPHSRLLALLAERVHNAGVTSGNHVVDVNYAESFPLDNKNLSLFNHVYRRSVRRLMASFELRNGARLWCSVRRSGKTTACRSDIGSTSGESEVVAQTCDYTDQAAEGTFYRKVCDALTSGRQLNDDFVTHTITQCQSAPADRRIVFVLDEYETLFGHLRTSMEYDPRLRYTVVQPLLNQLVAFTRDNLLIFVGQQPNAHWILTDQNQLSPILTQDPFPLFSHESAANFFDEFHELVQKIMSSHAELESAFVDQVYLETAGHPFLTAKLLVSFWTWLIDTRRSLSSLQPVRPELFNEFVRSQLRPTKIVYNRQYDMFLAAASEHRSERGREQHPWLHSVYAGMRQLVLDSPDTFSMPVDEFTGMVRRHCVGVSPEALLATASRANFLTFDGGVVRPKIRLLARIAAAV